MNLDKWKLLSKMQREAVNETWNTLNGDGFALAKEVSEDFKKHCRWNYEKVNILNRFTELVICVYLEEDDYYDAIDHPASTYLDFQIHYDKASNYFER